MTITTKYSLGDIVWVMQNDKIVSFPIGQIKPGTREEKCVYADVYKHLPYGDGPTYLAKQLYPTKEALLATL